MTIVNTTFRAFVEKLGDVEASTFIGNEGDLFYDPNTASLRVSDGTTPGGVAVAGVTSVSGPVNQSLIPDADDTYDLGSPTNQWRDIYATGNTLYLGGTAVSANASTLSVDGEDLAKTSEVQEIASADASASRLIVNTDRRVYTDATPGAINPNANSGGWYHRTTGGSYIRWNFWTPKPNAEGEAVGLLGNLESGWCLFTPWSSTTTYPFFQFYTAPKLSLGNEETWYRSKVTYSRAPEAHTPGTPVLLYFGVDPTDVFPGVPRREMTLDLLNTAGPQDADEFIYSSYLNTSTGLPDGDVEFSTVGVGFRYSGKNFGYSLYAVPEDTGLTEIRTLTGGELIEIVNGQIISIT
jgi:hypothetical protein